MISALLREHLRNIFVADERFVASLPYLVRNLKDSFQVRQVKYDGSQLPLQNTSKILDLLNLETQPTNYVLKMILANSTITESNGETHCFEIYDQ